MQTSMLGILAARSHYANSSFRVQSKKKTKQQKRHPLLKPSTCWWCGGRNTRPTRLGPNARASIHVTPGIVGAALMHPRQQDNFFFGISPAPDAIH